jgi:deazaflavin-dependent oxidoreductase (nitroreductase family)
MTDSIGEQLASWGKVVVIETRGRITGRPVSTAIGFVREDDGSLLVSAGDPDADWALNLTADPEAVAEVGGRRWDVVAEPLEGAERNRAIRELILRYGTPSEGLGRGPSFRLRPILSERSEPAEPDTS